MSGGLYFYNVAYAVGDFITRLFYRDPDALNNEGSTSGAQTIPYGFETTSTTTVTE